jgi:hypothetical protein
MTIKCELIMLIFTKTKNTRLPDSVHNAGVTLQSRDIPQFPTLYLRPYFMNALLLLFTAFTFKFKSSDNSTTV